MSDPLPGVPAGTFGWFAPMLDSLNRMKEMTPWHASVTEATC
ncbi:hypothetical protein SAMN05216561_10264 [Nocardioides psychrotolerans]|uniref:Uncharacterized protein n=1 Tax=Nocardioides psychrotolerans TaxID=1005945 RepID=A0A1I3CHA8_9ACTN|nr:hypothetical protein SAMN05216561_10264 [Nocardioides psychrotolerans]